MIAIVITARPSYSRVYSVIAALHARGVPLHLIVCASALLERYGAVIHEIRKDWPTIPIAECWSTYEGANTLTSARETAALLADISGCLSILRPTGVVAVADRHEVLAVAQAAAYQNIPLIHLQGGERSGSIDNKVRDSITHLADYHCVATEMAKYRVYGLTGALERIYQTGCPSVDIAKAALNDPLVKNGELPGVGPTWSLEREPFLIVLHHPVTDEVSAAADQMACVLEAISTGVPRVLLFWPGQDAGSEAMSKVIRLHPDSFHLIRNLPPRRFLRLLSQAACLVGNSSVGIREAAYLGVPVVNIGTRQTGRERAKSVSDVGYDVLSIRAAVLAQIAQGRYPCSTLYGDGSAGERVADVCQSL